MQVVTVLPNPQRRAAADMKAMPAAMPGMDHSKMSHDTMGGMK